MQKLYMNLKYVLNKECNESNTLDIEESIIKHDVICSVDNCYKIIKNKMQAFKQQI